jgi:hypothetical protein
MLYSTITMNTQAEFRAIADQLVVGLVGVDQIAAWWTSPNQAFDNLTPEQQWATGSDQVINYLMAHAFGGGT